MKTQKTQDLVAKMLPYYDPAYPIKGLEAILRHQVYTCIGDSNLKSSPLPMLKILLDDNTKMILPNPYFVRFHLSNKGKHGWLWCISSMKDHFIVNGDILCYKDIFIVPCYESCEIRQRGNILLVE